MNKILIIVMSHNNGGKIFDSFKNTWDRIVNLNKFPIDILFLYSNNNINEEYIIDGNNLISKCEENYWQSLLTKTINGFKYFVKNDYDLVFKTNLSTIVNLEKFYIYTRSLNYDDFIYEGFVGDYQDYLFCSGAGMILNKKSVDLILSNTNKIDDTWTDDIFIGFILNKLNNIQPNRSNLTRFDILEEQNINENIKDYTHIRIKIRDNNRDIYYTNIVFNLIYG